MARGLFPPGRQTRCERLTSSTSRFRHLFCDSQNQLVCVLFFVFCSCGPDSHTLSATVPILIIYNSILHRLSLLHCCHLLPQLSYLFHLSIKLLIERGCNNFTETSGDAFIFQCCQEGIRKLSWHPDSQLAGRIRGGWLDWCHLKVLTHVFVSGSLLSWVWWVDRLTGALSLYRPIQCTYCPDFPWKYLVKVCLKMKSKSFFGPISLFQAYS